ncbi:unnamed protein product [Didymodactylos carnosus]|uniref:Uncharacterized protein n=1 Tax=Didymodactylos carnosus TaxID=1234261 RepID=A0A8S2FBF2_9BILA|nr:unnamed protein product [Didymodactylos carnosus]CAF4213847.1 unnamed protein product [Didymodactylos carnosus]
MFIERIEKYLLLKRNRNGGYVLNKFEQEMKPIDYTQVLLNLQTPMPINILSIVESLSLIPPDLVELVKNETKLNESQHELYKKELSEAMKEAHTTVHHCS